MTAPLQHAPRLAPTPGSGGRALGGRPLRTPRIRPVAVADRHLVLTTAEVAECTCPEFCERDHDVD